jgi:adenylate kinase family enzyme
MEGNYVSRTFDLRLPLADAVIFIDQPRWLCVYRILWRWLTAFGRRRPDLAPGCEENFNWAFFHWVWNFHRQSQPRILEVAGNYPTPLTMLRGDAAMRRFLAEAR